MFSRLTLASLLAEVFINLSSGWLGVLLITPGFFQVASWIEYLRILITNLPFAILCFAIAYWLKINWRKK